MPQKTYPASNKPYACTRCGYTSEHHQTNHHAPTYNYGLMSTCPQCPPWAKLPEYGGSTTWTPLAGPPGAEYKRLEGRAQVIEFMAHLESNGYQRSYELTEDGIIVQSGDKPELWAWREDPPASFTLDWPAGGAFEFATSLESTNV